MESVTYQVIKQFFDVPIFWMTVITLMCDFATGVFRALEDKKFTKHLVPVALYKLFFYTIAFVQLHALVLWMPELGLTDSVIIGLLLMKEIISVLQNLKAIQIINNDSNPGLDILINFLRLNVFQSALNEVQPKPADSGKSNVSS